MRILLLNYEFPPIGGGGARASLNLLRQFAGLQDVEIDVLTSAAGGGLTIEKLSERITIYKVGISKKSLHVWRRGEILAWLFKAGREYKKLLASRRYDIIHIFFGVPTGLLCLMHGRKNMGRQLDYIVSMRGSDVPGANARFGLDYKILGPAIKSIWKNAGGLAACSNGLKERALQFCPGLKIEVIANGVDAELFRPDPKPRSKGPWKLLTVGRLSATKRVHILVEAVAILRQKGHDVTLTVAGGGALEHELKSAARTANLETHVEFAGIVNSEHMPDIYRGHDILVSASMQEGMSNAMLEAMASGLPIVTTRCEGIDELICGNGHVVHEDSGECLARAIEKLMTDPNLYESMRNHALEQARRFSWSAAQQSYLKLYEAVLTPVNAEAKSC